MALASAGGISILERQGDHDLRTQRAEETLRISPVLISEGVTSIREAARAGLRVAVLPDWLIEEDLLSGRLVRALPQWKAKDLPIHVVYAGQRLLPAWRG